ncbi:hypothetical protein AB0451_32500 [Streptomyces sp. NPDC052000]|uniref:hypothetical protein n=1 Tax=Streptomyces sp. NPDC052000 TaxID=3155676 RepID=UPI00344E5C9D
MPTRTSSMRARCGAWSKSRDNDPHTAPPTHGKPANRSPSGPRISLCRRPRIESAAEIAERHPQLDVVLVGRGEPGAAMNPKARVYLRAVLDRQVVRVRSGVEVMKVGPGAVELVGGEGVAADGVVWVGGRRESPPAAAGLAVDERGRVVTGTAHNVANPDKLHGVTRGTAHDIGTR